MKKKLASGVLSLSLILTGAAAVSAHPGGGNHGDRDGHVRDYHHVNKKMNKKFKGHKYRNSDLRVYMNGERFGATPILHSNMNLVPLRDISEVMNADVNYDEDTGKITVTKNGNTLILTIGSKTAYYNGNPDTIAVAPLVIDGVTYVPAQVFAKGLKAGIHYAPDLNVLKIVFK